MTDGIEKVAGDALDVVKAPLTKDLTNDPIDMTDIIGGGMLAPIVETLTAKLPFEEIASKSKYIPNAEYLKGFTQLGGALAVGTMTKSKGKTTTAKLTRKAGNMAQVGLGTPGAAHIVAGAARTIQKVRGGGIAETGTAPEQSIWNTPWAMQ
jgi:hypothetical protein